VKTVSICWFVAALTGAIICEVAYGFWAKPIDHVWSTVAYVALGLWLLIGTRMFERRKR
jgi:hypothetical protein